MFGVSLLSIEQDSQHFYGKKRISIHIRHLRSEHTLLNAKFIQFFFFVLI